MAGNRAAHRYAKSLISLAQDQNNLDAVYADMANISNSIAGSRELALLLKSPVVKSEKKQVILTKIFGKGASELTQKFIDTLTGKKREELLEGIALEFQAQYKTLKGIVVAEVTTAIALDDATKAKVMTLVQKHAEGNEIELIEKTNADIIGGFVIRIGDKMIDASIQRKLNDLKKELLGSSSYTVKLN